MNRLPELTQSDKNEIVTRAIENISKGKSSKDILIDEIKKYIKPMLELADYTMVIETIGFIDNQNTSLLLQKYFPEYQRDILTKFYNKASLDLPKEALISHFWMYSVSEIILDPDDALKIRRDLLSRLIKRPQNITFVTEYDGIIKNGRAYIALYNDTMELEILEVQKEGPDVYAIRGLVSHKLIGEAEKNALLVLNSIL